MGRPHQLGAADLAALTRTFRDLLRDHQAAVNRLNVYPVPDGDTGTNMALTLVSVCVELDELGPSPVLPEVCRAIAHGSLMGARGNSGVILSQILRGLADVWRDGAVDGLVDGRLMAAACSAAAKGAYGAVLRPVEGTILTVVREAAEAAERAAVEADGDLAAVLAAAEAGGQDALARTPELLPVLADAGVVDAGGAGLLLWFVAARHVLEGTPLPVAPADDELVAAGPLPVAVVRPDGHGAGPDPDELRYEVMYLLDAPDEAIASFKDVWGGLGDSIVVVGGEGLWNCHIHTNDIGGAIEAAIDCGRPRAIRVTDLHEQVEEERWVRDAPAAPVAAPAVAVTTAVVAVASGPGLQRILHSLGVQHVVTGGQSMNPSTAELLAAVEASPASAVVVLPNNKNIVPVAEQLDELSTKVVRVVPTRSITEGFAALVAYDPDGDVEHNRAAMAASAAHVVAGEVTQAVRDAGSDAGAVRTGDWLGLGDGRIRVVAPDLVGAACALLDVLVVAGHEIVTVIEGDGASAADTRRITAWLEEHRPDVAAEVHHGGQPLYPYLFGIE